MLVQIELRPITVLQILYNPSVEANISLRQSEPAASGQVIKNTPYGRGVPGEGARQSIKLALLTYRYYTDRVGVRENAHSPINLSDPADTFRLSQEKEMIHCKVQDADGQIDRLVYALYGLSEEEIKIVEGGRFDRKIPGTMPNTIILRQVGNTVSKH